MIHSVRLTREAMEDLQPIEEFLVELALHHGDFDLPVRAADAMLREMRILESNPYTCRKVGSKPLERELVIPFQVLQANQGKAGRAARRKAFEAEFADWIAAQSAWVEAHGIPGADLRSW